MHYYYNYGFTFYFSTAYVFQISSPRNIKNYRKLFQVEVQKVNNSNDYTNTIRNQLKL